MYFKEEQKFPYLLRVIFLICSLLIFISVALKNKSEQEWIGFVFLFLIIGLVNFIILSFKIITKITDEFIEVESNPLVGKKRYNMGELQDVKLYNTYQWSRFPMGWGYRLDFKGNVYHLAAGFKGLLLTKKNGKTVFIGSQKINELEEVVNYWNRHYGD